MGGSGASYGHHGRVSFKISLKDLTHVSEQLEDSITPEELQEMLVRADCDGDGEMDIDEFYGAMTRSGEVFSSYDENAIHRLTTNHEHQHIVE